MKIQNCGRPFFKFSYSENCKHWKCSMAFNYLLASVIISLPITNVIKAFCSLENGSTVFWDYKFFNNDLIQIAAVSENRRILRNNLKLTHILPQVSFYTLWKKYKTLVFDVCRGYTKRLEAWNGLTHFQPIFDF